MYSVLKAKGSNTNNPNTYAALNENDDFGTYIKELLPTITQRDDTITILANCTLKSDPQNSSAITKTIELYKLINGELKPLDEFVGMNITKFEDLKDLFKNISAQFTAPRKLIFTYGHGSVFGIFAQTQTIAAVDNLFNSIKRKGLHRISLAREIATIFKAKALSKLQVGEHYIGYENDYITQTDLDADTNRLLSNEELAQAIKASFGKIDILIMNNCLMQNVYAQTAFKDAVGYLIAPQSGITYPGFDLQNIFTSFAPTPDISKIAEKIVRFFDESKEAVTAGYLIMAYDLSGYLDVLNIIKGLKNYLQTKLENPLLSYKSNIVNSLSLVPLPFDQFISSGISMFDIFQWTNELLLKDPSTDLQNIVTSIEAYRNKITNYEFIGKEVNIVTKKGQHPFVYSKTNISGLCVYLPRNIQCKNSIIESVYDTSCDFENTVKWKEMVELYTSQTPKEIDNIKNNIKFMWVNPPG